MKENFEKLYYNAVKESCEAEKAKALSKTIKQRLAQIRERAQRSIWQSMSDQAEIKEENYVHKNRISNEKIRAGKRVSDASKTESMMPIAYKYHLIDLLRLSRIHICRKAGTEMGKLQVYI